MRGIKGVTISVLLGMTLVMHGMMAYAAEGCVHDWRMDRMEEMYSEEKDCNEHGMYCKVTITGYNVVETCIFCNDRRNWHYTEQTHRYLSR